jgi:hypothetical protein
VEGDTDVESLNATLRADSLSRRPTFIFSITNEGAEANRLLIYETPLEGIEGNIFQVERDGKPVGPDPAWAENDRGNGTDLGVLRGMKNAIELAA